MPLQHRQSYCPREASAYIHNISITARRLFSLHPPFVSLSAALSTRVRDCCHNNCISPVTMLRVTFTSVFKQYSGVHMNTETGFACSKHLGHSKSVFKSFQSLYEASVVWIPIKLLISLFSIQQKRKTSEGTRRRQFVLRQLYTASIELWSAFVHKKENFTSYHLNSKWIMKESFKGDYNKKPVVNIWTPGYCSWII